MPVISPRRSAVRAIRGPTTRTTSRAKMKPAAPITNGSAVRHLPRPVAAPGRAQDLRTSTTTGRRRAPRSRRCRLPVAPARTRRHTRRQRNVATGSSSGAGGTCPCPPGAWEQCGDRERHERRSRAEPCPSPSRSRDLQLVADGDDARRGPRIVTPARFESVQATSPPSTTSTCFTSTLMSSFLVA